MKFPKHQLIKHLVDIPAIYMAFTPMTAKFSKKICKKDAKGKSQTMVIADMAIQVEGAREGQSFGLKI
jgi:predicted HAD superfamily phosphohydrolase YqeG